MACAKSRGSKFWRESCRNEPGYACNSPLLDCSITLVCPYSTRYSSYGRARPICSPQSRFISKFFNGGIYGREVNRRKGRVDRWSYAQQPERFTDSKKPCWQRLSTSGNVKGDQQSNGNPCFGCTTEPNLQCDNEDVGRVSRFTVQKEPLAISSAFSRCQFGWQNTRADDAGTSYPVRPVLIECLCC